MAPYIGNSLPGAQVDRPAPEGPDEFDDLFDYDVGDDPFADIDEVLKPLPANSTAQNNRDGIGKGAGLGIDEVVEVAKKIRVPRVKLDENRLLSQAGIPKLRKRANDLKFKGKGHEYSDAARLLSFYQLWLDDLFPKAKFLDAAAVVEKLGHKRRMQIMRMDWINEGKPRSSVHEDLIFDEPVLPPRTEVEVEKRTAPIFESTARQERLNTPDFNEVEEDIYDSTPLAQRAKPAEPQKSMFGGGNSSLFGPKETPALGEDLEDDLDALLAEHERELENEVNGGNTHHGDTAVPFAVGHTSVLFHSEKAPSTEPNFDDEMEAMEAMGDMEDIW